MFSLATGFIDIGGLAGLEEKYMNAASYEARELNNTCGEPNPDAFVMLRDPVSSDMPWPGFVFGQTTASLWYWATDQVGIHHCVSGRVP